MQMAQQEEGWPLGLNLRAGMERNRDLNGSISFNTLLTGSPISSSNSSSDLDTESTGSFFHDKSITLGSLIGISSILELSRISRGRKSEPVIQNKKINKTKAWFLSLCSRLSTDAVSMNNTPSLAHFLEAERRATFSHHTRNPASSNGYGPDDFSRVLNPNLLFVDGQIAPPQSNNVVESNGERLFSRDLLSDDNTDDEDEPPSLLPSCLCGNCSH